MAAVAGLSLGGVTKVGAGESLPDALVPIDVHCDKLIDWLVDRKRLCADWRRRLAAIRARAASAAATLPPELAARVLGDGGAAGAAEAGAAGALDYAACCTLRDALEAAEAAAEGGGGSSAARGLFGARRGAGVAREWDALVKAYDKDGLHLPEAAQLLLQAAEYEVPLLRKTAAKATAQLGELERREAEARAGGAAAAAAYAAACQEWGVRGVALKRELADVAAAEVPATWRRCAELLRGADVAEGAALYDAFCRYAHGGGKEDSAAADVASRAAGATSAADAPLLPLLAKLGAAEGAQEGPTWAQLGFPEQQAAPPADVADAAPPADDVPTEINWDIGTAADAAPGASGGADPSVVPTEISWDISVDDVAAAADMGTTAAAEEASGGIDWSIELADADASGAADVAAGAGEIRWDVDAADVAAEQAAQADRLAGDAAPIEINWDIEVAAPVADAPEAQLASATTAAASANDVALADLSPDARRLNDAAVRGAVANELLELRAFLAQRHREMGTTEEALAAAAPGAPPQLQRASRESVAAARDAAAAAAALLTCRRTRELLLLQTSPNFLHRLVASIEGRASAHRKLDATLADVAARRQAARRQLAAAAAELAALQARMRRVKAAAEGAISAMYGGRPVHIIGEVNNCL